MPELPPPPPDVELVELLAVALRGRGMRVTAVGDGMEARVSTAALGPQVAVVDTDAVSVCQATVAIQAAVGPRPLVLLTGSREPTLGTRGGCRVVARLPKPFRLEDLVGAIRLVLSHRRPPGTGGWAEAAGGGPS